MSGFNVSLHLNPGGSVAWHQLQGHSDPEAGDLCVSRTRSLARCGVGGTWKVIASHAWVCLHIKIQVGSWPAETLGLSFGVPSAMPDVRSDAAREGDLPLRTYCNLGVQRLQAAGVSPTACVDLEHVGVAEALCRWFLRH